MPVYPRMTRMEWSTGSTSACHNTVPANSTPKTRRSSARLSSGHHSAVMFIPMCACSSAVVHVHLYPPPVHLVYRSCSHVLVYSSYPCASAAAPTSPTSVYFDHSSIQLRVARLCKVVFSRRPDCLSVLASRSVLQVHRPYSFSKPYILLVDIQVNVTYTPCTV